MGHDLLCETRQHFVDLHLLGRQRDSTTYSGSCKCASRAYKADPLPNDWTPIWAKAKTPGQEGG
jgi:hypothetical protein